MDIDSVSSVIQSLPFTETIDIPMILSNDSPTLDNPHQSSHELNLNDNPPNHFEIPANFLTQTLPLDPSIYIISGDQYHTLQNSYASHKLPDNVLFPWLHGVDGRSYQQNLFFGIRRSLVPKYCGLMLVHADQSLIHNSRLVDSVLPNDILSPDGSEFLHAFETDATINLRNFKIQVGRCATISDIVVYGADADRVASRIRAAQIKLRQERMKQLEKVKRTAGSRAIANANTFEYKTLVIKDPFSVFESNYPELVCSDSNGIPINRVNFGEREKEEMLKMSTASEVTPNIWVGNTQDTPASTQSYQDKDDELSFEDDNPHRFSVCIEAHDLADMPLPSTLTLAKETLNEIPVDEVPSEIIHLDVYSTGVPMNAAVFDNFYARLIPLLEFMDDQANRGKRILIHCSDGYTETSLVVLSWVMYKNAMRLPEAYVYLQKKRSFFVYSGDIITLKKVDKYLQSNTSISPRDHKRKREDTCSTESDRGLPSPERSIGDIEGLNNDLYDNDNDNDIDNELDNELEDEDTVVQDLVRDNRTLHADSYINTISNNPLGLSEILPLPTTGQPAAPFVQDMSQDVDETMPSYLFSEPLADSSDKSRFPWFYSPRFEGSFPSRILPFLYLGNLNHATNPEMLKILDITHVVSVGENANLDTSQFELLFLDNLYDDGIDSVRGRMDEVMRFVEDARKQGSRCLIHCRVGVSRSAAITIAYVMNHLGYNIVEAYLYVRARRLNVIIQPNLKFMYEMLQLEQQLFGRTSIAWHTLSNEIHLLNMTYREA
ncbi:protein-tyrosine phosphatase-like protein [Phycomyces nitens]|nr:protein-tyrosine phosphatase-like protein [Phycomyces nitens]